jgi:Ca-activated chloride channel family protein
MSRIELDDPRLTAYVLNELAPEERAVIDAAQDADPALRAELEALRQTIGMLAEELSREPAPELEPAQRAAVELRAVPPRPPRPARYSPLVVMAQLALMAVPVLILMSAGTAKYQSMGQSRPPSNQHALLPRGQSPEVRKQVGRELAPKPPKLGSRLRSSNDYYYDYTRGYSGDGYAAEGFDRNGFDRNGFDRHGFDKNGFNQRGFAREGLDRDGYDSRGFDRRGYDRAGYDRSGRDRKGLDRKGQAGGVTEEASGAASTAFRDYNRHRDALRKMRDEGLTPPAVEPLTENAFLDARAHPLSTFSIDVDTASYSKVRRYLTEGARPPAAEVRVEELINYFPYSYPEPDAGEPLTVAAEVAGAPWTPGHRLVRVALKARSIAPAQRPASNLVFLVDVSGSMEPEDRLPLVQRSLEMLLPQLSGQDRIAIVVYAGSSGLVLPSTAGDQKAKIGLAIRNLQAGGSTNGGEGIELAYRIAREHFIEGGNNRVVLATDGDFNVGITSPDALEAAIKEKAKSGVFLSVLGYGMGNHQDATLERLADRGNGNHAYIDTLLEAHKVLVEQMAGTLVTVAKDVKIQLEFDPAQVASYRLIGYENRALENRDFTDDTKDAGEMGAGHTVTALYEIVPAAEPGTAPMLTVKVRHQPPAGGASRELTFPVTDRGTPFMAATPDFRWAAAVAGFGMELRGSRHRGNLTLELVRGIAVSAVGADPGGYRAELIELVKRAEAVR